MIIFLFLWNICFINCIFRWYFFWCKCPLFGFSF